jgi:hypothetical protein
MLTLQTGPLFVVPRRADIDSTATDKKPATEVGTSPYALEEHGITLSRPLTMKDIGPHPIMHNLYFEGTMLVDETRILGQHPSYDPECPQADGTFHKAITAAAAEPETVNMHLRLVELARLESVDRRDGEKKGSGKVGFEEFERAAREGRMRFLESWMDWVSF